MKKFKKIVSILLTTIMVLAMCVPVMATEPSTATNTISVKSGDTHTYNVYQIFTGTLSNGKLTAVKWGKNAASRYTEGNSVDESILTGLQALTGTDATKLSTIKTYVDLTSTVFGTVDKDNALSVPSGYYLIKDKDSYVDKDDAATTYIVKVCEDVEIARKAVKPTVDKQVQDNEIASAVQPTEDSTFDPILAGNWGETADHEINKSFKFKLIATLPASDDYASYEKYKLQFVDKMSNGVTYESIDSVTVDGITITDYTVNGVANGEAGKEWTLTIDDVKTIAGVNLTDGAEVVVIYNAHLNEKATVNDQSGSTDNKNTVHLKYSNNPNVSGEGEMGKTAEDTVWVFTYTADYTKVDGSTKDALPGAGFKLYYSDGKTEVPLVKNADDGYYYPQNSSNTTADHEMISAAADGTFKIKGLDAGTYILKETTVPAGYNKCDDITVKIQAGHKEIDSGTDAYVHLATSNAKDVTIENKQGSTLPETGGMGTTIFYVVGVTLMLGAGVLLVTKRRMNANH